MSATDWQPIATAPKDGTKFIGGAEYIHHWGKYRPVYRFLSRKTWHGKASHVPLYGWCHGRVENVDLWEPTHWKPV